MFNIDQLYPYQYFFISLGLGLIVGLQREWAESSIAGIRSFALVSLFGTICGHLLPQFGSGMIYIGLGGIVSITLLEKISLFKKNEIHRGLVTEISLMTMFLVGVLVSKEQFILATILTGLLTVILQLKIELHRIATKFSDDEIRSIIKFVAITLVIYPILPRKTFGPNEVLNLPEIWLMVILIYAINLIGQLIYKFKNDGNGVLWAGIIGGLISSTATTLGSSKLCRTSENKHAYYTLIILISWMTLYIRVFLELLTVAPLMNPTFPLGTLFIASSLPIIWVWKLNSKKLSQDQLKYSKISLKTAISFAFFYTIILCVFSLSHDQIAKSKLSTIAFFSGILDVDAITLSTGRLVQKGILTTREGYQHLFLALLANILFKGCVSMMIGGNILRKIILYPWIILVIFHTGLLIYAFS
jgi:uncharacterized membrane protein (DUF4010 family)